LRQIKGAPARGHDTGRCRLCGTLPTVSKRFPIHPPNPERNCWGCDRYCKATDMACGNGSDRTQHPIETWGPGWEASLTPETPAEAIADSTGGEVSRLPEHQPA
jgi:hypothetical protein